MSTLLAETLGRLDLDSYSNMSTDESIGVFPILEASAAGSSSTTSPLSRDALDATLRQQVIQELLQLRSKFHDIAVAKSHPELDRTIAEGSALARSFCDTCETRIDKLKSLAMEVLKDLFRSYSQIASPHLSGLVHAPANLRSEQQIANALATLSDINFEAIRNRMSVFGEIPKEDAQGNKSYQRYNSQLMLSRKYLQPLDVYASRLAEMSAAVTDYRNEVNRIPLAALCEGVVELIDKDLSYPSSKAYRSYVVDVLKRSLTGWSYDITETLSMQITGPTGVGKSTTATKISSLMYLLGYLSSPDREDYPTGKLKGQFEGNTEHDVAEALESGIGRVVVLDETYALLKGESDREGYGMQALMTILDVSGRLCGLQILVMVGYEDEIAKVMAVNQGFPRRFQHSINIEPFNVSEMLEVMEFYFNKMVVTERVRFAQYGIPTGYSLQDSAKSVAKLMLELCLGPQALYYRHCGGMFSANADSAIKIRQHVGAYSMDVFTHSKGKEILPSVFDGRAMINVFVYWAASVKPGSNVAEQPAALFEGSLKQQAQLLTVAPPNIDYPFHRVIKTLLDFNDAQLAMRPKKTVAQRDSGSSSDAKRRSLRQPA